MQLYKNFGIAC